MRITRWLPFLGLLLVGADALARAGGGEHYSGGSRSSGGGSHGGGGSGGDLIDLFRLLYWVIRLTVDYPKVMLPIWAILIGGVIFMSMMNAKATTQRGLRGLDRERLDPSDEVDEHVAALQKRDAKFDLDAFLERTKRVFVAVQESWFLRKLDTTRSFASDGLHRRFVVLQKLMAAEGRRDALADVRVNDLTVLAVESGKDFDTITVLVAASLRDTELPADTSDAAARQAAQRAKAESFEEIWTFVRRRGRESKPEWDLSQGACPNCGAPFTGGAANKCDHCGAVVNSGAYDWVLSAITQVEAFIPRRPGDATIAPLRAADPSVNPEILEDRALLLFWKWVEAQSLATPAVLRQVATPGAFAAIAADVSQGGPTPRLRVPAVGSANVLAVEVGNGGFDRVHVEVAWSASDGAGGRSRPRRHVVTLVRASGGSTDRGGGLSTDRCGNCGAPLTEADRTTCEYCGSDFTRAEKDWLLEAVTPRASWKKTRAQGPDAGAAMDDASATLLPAHASPVERARLLQLMASMALADGVVDRKERSLLKNAAKRWGVEWDDVQAVLDGDVDVEPPEPGGEFAREFVRALVAIAKVDGRIDGKERRFIVQAGAHAGLAPDEVERLIV